jgi:hypothetical protein
MSDARTSVSDGIPAADTDILDLQANPWGTYRPRGLSALCFAALRFPMPMRSRLYRLLERLGPWYDVEILGLRHRLHAREIEQYDRRGWPIGR